MKERNRRTGVHCPVLNLIRYLIFDGSEDSVRVRKLPASIQSGSNQLTCPFFVTLYYTYKYIVHNLHLIKLLIYVSSIFALNNFHAFWHEYVIWYCNAKFYDAMHPKWTLGRCITYHHSEHLAIFNILC